MVCMEAPKLKLLADAGILKDPVILRRPDGGWMVSVEVDSRHRPKEDVPETRREWVTVRGGRIRIFKKIETALNVLENWGLTRATIKLKGEDDE